MKELGPMHTYELTLLRDVRTAGLLVNYCEDCEWYVRPGPHICRVIPAGEPRGSQEGFTVEKLKGLEGIVAATQPPPQPGDEAVVPLAIEYLQAKADRGEAKYGSQLETFNGRSALIDALEDSADTYLYLFQACREKGLV